MAEDIWFWDISDKIKEKLRITAVRNRGKIPYTTEDGVFDDWTHRDICWWTNGFWGGILWQMYYAAKEESYRKLAEDLEKKLDRNLMLHHGMDHDSGFKWLPTAVADYRLTGNPESFNRAMLAADNLAGRFNPAGRFIRAWNDNGDGSKAGWAIIDCMMNLPLLYWASEETKDPRYKQIAMCHADTAMKYFIREDGSVNHIVEFNPVTGAFVQSFGGQGYGAGSSWTRGQAWGIYGFTLSFIHTGERRYLDSAKKIADYFIANIPENGLIPVDFRQPEDCHLEDSTAGAIAACGMLELARRLEDGDGGSEEYKAAAVRMLLALAQYRCNWAEACDNILEKCTGAFHDEKHEFAIIYGDYFFMEAVWKLTGQELFIW